MSRNHSTNVVPSAGTTRIGALVPSEVVDHDSNVTVLVQGARATRAGARCRGRAVVLSDVVEFTILQEGLMSNYFKTSSQPTCTYPVIPGTSTAGIGALVAREDID